MRAGFQVHAPDFIGAHDGDIEFAVRADLKGVGHGDIVEDQAGRAAVAVQFHDPRAHAAFARDQAALMPGDRVGDGHVAIEDARFPVGREHRHAAFGDFGEVEIASIIEHQIVGRDDRAAHRADGRDGACIDVDRADLAAADLGDIEAAVRAGGEAVRAVEAAGGCEAFEAPPFRRRHAAGRDAGRSALGHVRRNRAWI